MGQESTVIYEKVVLIKGGSSLVQYNSKPWQIMIKKIAHFCSEDEGCLLVYGN